MNQSVKVNEIEISLKVSSLAKTLMGNLKDLIYRIRENQVCQLLIDRATPETLRVFIDGSGIESIRIRSLIEDPNLIEDLFILAGETIRAIESLASFEEIDKLQKLLEEIRMPIAKDRAKTERIEISMYS